MQRHALLITIYRFRLRLNDMIDGAPQRLSSGRIERRQLLEGRAAASIVEWKRAYHDYRQG